MPLPIPYNPLWPIPMSRDIACHMGPLRMSLMHLSICMLLRCRLQQLPPCVFQECQMCATLSALDQRRIPLICLGGT